MKLLLKKILSVLSAAVFLTTVAGPVGNAFAQEPWPVWPREGAQPPPATVGDTGEEAGEKIGSTIDYGSVAKYALIGAAVIAVIIAIGSGGSSETTTPPAHTTQ